MKRDAKVSQVSDRALVVSLHDVSPLTQTVFTAMLDDLAAWGVAQCSLLVIPDHHHRGNMLADKGFCRWLEGLAGRGHEIVAHGYYHQRAAQLAETWRERMMTRVYTQGEGEFYDLSREEASELLERGKSDFSKLDVPAPSGFVAPAWLLSEGAAEAVRAAGFRYTTYLTGVQDYLAGEEGGMGEFIPARSLVYSPRNRWRRVCSLAYNAGLCRVLRGAPLLRLGLHPPDYEHAGIWAQVQRIVRGALRERTAMTYGGFLAGRGTEEKGRANIS